VRRCVVGLTVDDQALRLVELGRGEREAGRLVAALELFEQAITRTADDWTPYLEAGRTLHFLGSVSAARERLTQAATQWPDVWQVTLELAEVAAKSGDGAAALDHYLRVIELQPTIARAYLGAAEQMLEADMFIEAEEILDRGLAKLPLADEPQPELLEAKATTVVCLRGDLEEGAVLLEAALAATGDVRSITSCLAALANHGRVDDALELLRQLRPAVERLTSDLLDLEWRERTILVAKRFADMARESCELDRDVELLHVKPLFIPDAEPLKNFTPSHKRLGPPSKYYMVANLLPDAGPQTLPPPVNRVISGDLETLRHWPTVRQRESAYYVYELNDCFIYKRFNRDGSCAVVGRSHFVDDLVSEYSPIRLARLVPATKRSDKDALEEAFALHDNLGWLNYYHGIIDICSSLVFFQKLGLTCPVIVPGQLTPTHRQVLAASGLAESTRILTADDVDGIQIRRLYCPQRVAGQLLREWCKNVAGRVVGPHDLAARQDIVYISREQATRQPRDEGELQKELTRRFGARIVHTENLTFETQVRIVSNARVVISPHGAGLTNIIFAPPGAWVVELLPDRHLRPLFRDLAAVAGQRYVPIIGKVDALESMDWRIDVDKVLRVLEVIVSLPEPQ
jgi:tetratricopeptide (TPR) repeat protein